MGRNLTQSSSCQQNKARRLIQEYGFQIILTCLFDLNTNIHFTSTHTYINLESTTNSKLKLRTAEITYLRLH